MKSIKVLLAASLFSSALVNTSYAAEWSVSITNMMHGSYFTPLLITAHSGDITLFQAGQAASPELQTMAEGGDISGLVALVGGEDADTIANPAEGLLAPGGNTTTELNTDSMPQHEYLSIVSMILPSNDAFIGLNAIKIPTQPGTYTYHLNAYDAGTEANNELVAADGGTNGVLGMPNPNIEGVGSGGTGVTTTEANQTVHIHRNVLGDTDSTGGISDIDSRIHRWLNPVAGVRVTVK